MRSVELQFALSPWFDLWLEANDFGEVNVSLGKKTRRPCNMRFGSFVQSCFVAMVLRMGGHTFARLEISPPPPQYAFLYFPPKE